MNIRAPINTHKKVFYPHTHPEEILRLAELPYAVAEAKKTAAARFLGENPDFDAAEVEIKRAPKRLRKLKRELWWAKRRKRFTPEVRSWRTGKSLKPLGIAQRIKIVVFLCFILVDVPVLVYTSAQYVLASGAIETLADSIWSAIPFTFLLATGVIGLKALAETHASEEARERFTAALLWVGVAALVCFALFVAVTFNPASIPSTTSPDAGLANMVTSTRISWGVASGLVLSQIFGTVTFGAGVSLSVLQTMDRNKALVTEKCAAFETASLAVDEIKEQCATLEAEITRNAAYVARYEGTLDHYVEAQAARVASMRNYLAAKRRTSHYETIRNLAEAGD